LNQARPITASSWTRISEAFKPLILATSLKMKAVIICDDFAFVAQANAKLQRVGRRRDVRAQWSVKSWPVNALNQSGMAEKALVEAADAHLIIVPARRAHTFPPWLRDWLERWAALRQIPEAALAVIGDVSDTDSTMTVSPELTSFVRKNGLNFITDKAVVPKNRTKLEPRAPRERTLPQRTEQSRFVDAATRDSFRGLGINE
jgi:hypothetical protein